MRLFHRSKIPDAAVRGRGYLFKRSDIEYEYVTKSRVSSGASQINHYTFDLCGDRWYLTSYYGEVYSNNVLVAESNEGFSQRSFGTFSAGADYKRGKKLPINEFATIDDCVRLIDEFSSVFP